MSAAKTLTFYLKSPFKERAQSGGANFLNKVTSAFESRGFSTEIRENSDLEILQSAQRPGYSMFFMEDPFHSRALTMRVAYYYPFWRIERSGKRWEWDVAKAKFEPEDIDQKQAEMFISQWRQRLYGSSDLPSNSDQGYVYIPLQGRLLERRSFQMLSPIKMIEATLENDPKRQIYLTFHPKEQYSRAEIAAVTALEKKFPKLSIVSGEVTSLVRDCAYIVTQNSSVVLDGFFQNKPAILFGQIDFHHIANNVSELGIEKAFLNVQRGSPDYASYLFWFLQKMSINAGREDVQERVLKNVRSHGWDV